jgi:ribosomal-protein-alanine N-acetyltransferase
MSDELRRRRHAIYLAADSGDVLVGYAGAWCYEGEAHIMNLAVAPDFRRQGIGEALLMELLRRTMEAGADLAYLEVRPSNRRAIALYRKLGFTEAGRRARYYRDTGEDAILMTRFDLPGSLPSRLRTAWEAWEGRHGPRPEFG